MQIVTDSGMDLAPEQLKDLDIHVAPLMLYLDGNSYYCGVDIDADEFYRLLEASGNFPSTSQPSAGDFKRIYQNLAKTDPEILSIHISSGLSGTLAAARAGAEMVPEAHVTFVDSKSLSVPFGWQVEAAAKAIKAGWSIDQIIALLEKIRANSEGMFTLPTLKYLIHGGRISHLTGLVASLLSIKPVIGVDRVTGKYVNWGQEVTIKRALRKMVDNIEGWYGAGTELRAQPIHANNLAMVAVIKEMVDERFPVRWDPPATIAPSLGAHTGSGLVGICAGPAEIFPF